VTRTLLRAVSGAFLVALLVAAGLFAPSVPANAATAAPGSLVVQLVAGVGVSANAVTAKASHYDRVVTNASGIATFPSILGGAIVSVQVLTFEYQYEFTPTVKSGIAVAPGQVKKTSVTVARGGVVEGKVTLPGGGAFKYGQVVAVDSLGNAVANTSTDINGKYSLRGLKTGSYAIQFNGRNWADSKVALVTNYGWGYYGGGTLQATKKVAVTTATATSNATVRTGINGAVPSGRVTTFSLATQGSGQLNIEKIVAGKVIVAETVFSPLYSPYKIDKVRLASGTYRLAVEYKIGATKVQYFYTGPGKKLSTDRTKAVLFTVGSGDLAVAIGARP
jgi:hypothetical protein